MSELKASRERPWHARLVVLGVDAAPALDHLTQSVANILVSARRTPAQARQLAFEVRRSGGSKYGPLAGELAILYADIVETLTSVGWSFEEWLVHRAELLVRSLKSDRRLLKPRKLEADCNQARWLIVELAAALERETMHRETDVDLDDDVNEAIRRLQDGVRVARAKLGDWRAAQHGSALVWSTCSAD